MYTIHCVLMFQSGFFPLSKSGPLTILDQAWKKMLKTHSPFPQGQRRRQHLASHFSPPVVSFRGNSNGLHKSASFAISQRELMQYKAQEILTSTLSFLPIL